MAHQLSQLKHNNAMATAKSYLLQGNQNIPIVPDTSLSLMSKKINIFVVNIQFTIKYTKLKNRHILYTEHTGSLHACVATNKTIKVFKNKKSKFSGGKQHSKLITHLSHSDKC